MFKHPYKKGLQHRAGQGGGASDCVASATPTTPALEHDQHPKGARSIYNIFNIILLYIGLYKMDITTFYTMTTKDSGDTNTLSYRRARRDRLMPFIEDMMNDLNVSEITITFKECYRMSYDNEFIGRLVEAYFKDILIKYDVMQVLLIPEYGENHHLHYHGLIQGGSKDISQVLTYLKRRFGRSTIRMVKYPESYKKYIMKEQTKDPLGDIDLIMLAKIIN